jgi:hypothetical protein
MIAMIYTYVDAWHCLVAPLLILDFDASNLWVDDYFGKWHDMSFYCQLYEIMME